jgi:hypothetical protein
VVPPASSFAKIPRTPGTLVLTKVFGLIVFTKCSFCRRPGEAGRREVIPNRRGSRRSLVTLIQGDRMGSAGCPPKRKPPSLVGLGGFCIFLCSVLKAEWAWPN